MSERPTGVLERLGTWGLLLLPGVLAVFFSLNAGGLFPGTPGLVAVVLLLLLVSRIIVASHPRTPLRTGIRRLATKIRGHSSHLGTIAR